MSNTALDPDAIELARTAARAADSKSATSTVILGVGPVLGICEAFVVTSASNRRLVKTVAEEVEEQVRAAHGRSPRRTEGVAEQQWVLIDYGDVVVHVFSEEMRSFYDIERLYRDVRKIEWSPAGE